MAKARITEEEIRAALRARGMAEPSKATSVILERDGSLLVIGEASA